ncbi:flagella assembly protein FlgT middle domain-containing protein [Granulosicoccus sp. 3-233]|uniref:flagella assembly protein FlgT middle domain-containing protein n=1 Tax=Granulosicoccus sp. 3-233 TaxID=3417969 RepID=UPI003D352B94
MTVTVYKLSIVAVVSLLLAGCSLPGKLPFVGLWKDTPQVSPTAAFESSGALESCSPDPGTPFSYRKAILVAGTISTPDLARDLPGLPTLTSLRLQTHLDELGRFNVFATHDSSFESMGPSTAGRVRQLGREYASQFVVKLDLEDLSIQPSGGWFDELLGGSDQRNIQMRLYIYDVEYGALFHSRQYQQTVSGDVVGYPGNGRTVSTPWFDTDLGKQIDTMLEGMSLEINEKLACVPFSAEVTSIRGNDIHINAGFLHGFRSGDTLRVYRRTDILEPDEIQQPGENDSWIKVHTVFPNHSIASTAQEGIGGYLIDTGDVVRAW